MRAADLVVFPLTLKVLMNKISALLARGSALVVTSAFMASAAMAQTVGNPLTDALDSVDLTGLVVKIAAAGLVIVGIALAFKGPTLAKRVVNKV